MNEQWLQGSRFPVADENPTLSRQTSPLTAAVSLASSVLDRKFSTKSGCVNSWVSAVVEPGPFVCLPTSSSPDTSRSSVVNRDQDVVLHDTGCWTGRWELSRSTSSFSLQRKKHNGGLALGRGYCVARSMSLSCVDAVVQEVRASSSSCSGLTMDVPNSSEDL